MDQIYSAALEAALTGELTQRYALDGLVLDFFTTQNAALLRCGRRPLAVAPSAADGVPRPPLFVGLPANHFDEPDGLLNGARATVLGAWLGGLPPF